MMHRARYRPKKPNPFIQCPVQFAKKDLQGDQIPSAEQLARDATPVGFEFIEVYAIDEHGRRIKETPCTKPESPTSI